MSRRLFHGQLADEIAGEDRLRAERLRLLARSLVDILRDALARDGIVRIHGFGTFRLKRAAPRRGVNPRTGEPIDIPARNRVLFRPARALRDRVEPDHHAAVPLAEPHESREAWLGGRMAESPVAGGLPPGDHERSERRYFPDRVAAASMAAPTARVSASAYPDSARDSASREASLGGAMADSPSAGRVVTADNADSGPAETGSDAANDDSAPAEPGSGSAPDQPVAPPAAPAEYRPPERTDRSAAREEEHDTGETGRIRETDFPTLTERADTTETEPAPSSDDGLAPASKSGRDERGPAGRWLALVALLLLAVLLAWWLWPRTEPTPVASGTPGVTTERTDEAATESEPEASGGTDSGAAEPVSSEAATEEPTDATGQAASATGATDATEPPETAARTAEATGSAAEATQSAATQAEASPAEDGEADGQPAQPEPQQAEATTAEPDTAAPEQAGGTAATGAGDAAAGEATSTVEAGADSQPAGGTASGAEEAMTQAEASAAETATAETAPSETATPWFSGREYSVTAGDTLWDLSDRNYVNPYYWPHIWNHNQSLANPDRIEIDQQLWLPRLVGEPRSLTAADRRSIAEGYLRLYRFWKDTGAANPQYALVGVRYFDASVMPPELRNDPSAGRPGDAMAAAFEALLMAEFPAPQ